MSRFCGFAVLLVPAVLTFFLVETAAAYVDTGRDGRDPGAYFDIASTKRIVWTSGTGHRNLMIWVRGVEPLYEFAPLRLRVPLDSRGDAEADSIMVIRNGDSASGERQDCVVVVNGAIHEGRWQADLAPSSGTPGYYDRFGCRIRAAIVRLTHRIHWAVTSDGYPGSEPDRAPDHGWYR